jgi:hypothetical protein
MIFGFAGRQNPVVRRSSNCFQILKQDGNGDVPTPDKE